MRVRLPDVVVIVVCGVLSLPAALAQTTGQPQTQTATSSVNAQWANGVGPGYWPTAGSGLTLNISGGTTFCQGSVVEYTAGTLSLTASTTNYIYLNTSSSCAPAVKTTAFVIGDIPVAIVVTSGTAITSINDVRSEFSTTPAPPVGPTYALQYKNGSTFGGDANLVRDANGDLTSTGYFSGTKVILNGTTAACGQQCDTINGTWATRATASGNENNYLMAPSLTSYGPGRAFGPIGSGGWTVPKYNRIGYEDDVRGIGQAENMNYVSHSIADKAVRYDYGDFDAGCGAVLNDEGCSMYTAEFTQNGSGGTATMTGGTNTVPTLSTNIPTSDGGFLVDLSDTADTYVGSLNGPNTGSMCGVYDIPVTVSTSLPMTTAAACTTEAIPDTNLTADQEVSFSVTVTPQAIGGVTNNLVSGWACMAGPSSISNIPEGVYITAVSPDGLTVTLNHRYPHYSGAGIFQGPLCFHTLSIDDDLTHTHHRSTYETFGSLTGNDVLYVYRTFGQTSMPIPRLGETAETNTSAFHIIPAEEIVANLSRSGNPEVEPNPYLGSGTVGHTLEADQYFTMLIRDLYFTIGSDTPCNASLGCYGFSLGYGGTSISGAFTPFTLQNSTSSADYSVNGGFLSLPRQQLLLEGPTTWDTYVDKPYGGLYFVNTSIGTGTIQSYGILFDNAGGNVMSYTQNQTGSTSGGLAPGEAQVKVGTGDFTAPCFDSNAQGPGITTTCQMFARNGGEGPSLVVETPGAAPPVNPLAFESQGNAQFDTSIGGPVGSGLTITPDNNIGTAPGNTDYVRIMAYTQPGGFYATVLQTENTNAGVVTFPGLQLVPDGGALTVGTSGGHAASFLSEVDFGGLVKHNAEVDFNSTAKLTTLTNQPCVGTNSTGAFQAGTCGSGISKIQVTTGTAIIGANACTTSSTATMTGLATTSSVSWTPQSDISSVTGWGAVGGLKLIYWPTVNTLNYRVCNQTATAITPSASVTWNVSAQ